MYRLSVGPKAGVGQLYCAIGEVFDPGKAEGTQGWPFLNANPMREEKRHVYGNHKPLGGLSLRYTIKPIGARVVFQLLEAQVPKFHGYPFLCNSGLEIGPPALRPAVRFKVIATCRNPAPSHRRVP